MSQRSIKDSAEEAKKCFVISPIGDEGTDVRRRADQILNHVIKPVTEGEYSYVTTRADALSSPGMITGQIIDHLLHDDLVIADLTGVNPNVTYELAIRHMIRKHVIMIKDSSDRLPFDIADVRTVSFDYRFVDSMEECKIKIKEQIEAIRNNPDKVESPITHAINLSALEKSDEPYKTALQHMQSDIEILMTAMKNLVPKSNHPVFLRRDEALEPFSGQTSLTVAGSIPTLAALSQNSPWEISILTQVQSLGKIFV